MLIYIHVPFCRSKCNYCAFHSLALGRRIEGSHAELINNYVDTLMLELAHYGEKLGNTEVESVFFGGGTPSLLPPEVIGSFLDKAARYFKMSSKAEVTLEANPESLRGRNALPGFLSAGVNRLSIGVQSFDDNILRMLGRQHKAADSLAAVFAAREAGFQNVGIDLMWGLPGQSMRQWLQTLEEAVKLAPDHISSYGLTLEHGTVLEEEVSSGALHLPPERDQSIMFMRGAAYLEANGYLHYEISNFARMGYQCAHNVGYWEGKDYLGLGPSSTSTIDDKRWTNPAAPGAWSELIRNGNPGGNAETLTPKIRALEMVMLGLRTARGLRLKDFRDFTGRDFLRDNQQLVQALHENGLARIRNGYLSLTRSGMLVSNAIISNIFESVENALGPDPYNFNKDPLPPANAKPVSAKAAPRPVIWPQAGGVGNLERQRQ